MASPTPPSPLDYAAPPTKEAPSMRLVLLACANIAAGSLSLFFVPLISHVRVCTGPDWCHMQALLFGVPAAWVTGLLFVVTLVWALAGTGQARSRTIRLLVALPLSVPVAILMTLLWAVGSSR